MSLCLKLWKVNWENSVSMYSICFNALPEGQRIETSNETAILMGGLQCPSEKSLWIFRAWAVLQFENHSNGTIIQLKRYFCFARSLHADDRVWSTWDWCLLWLLHNWDSWDGLTCLKWHYQLLSGTCLIPSLVLFTLRWDLPLRGSMVLRLQQWTHRTPASPFTRWLTMGKSLKLWVPQFPLL